MRLHTLPNGIHELERDPGIAAGMGLAAGQLRSRISTHGATTLSTRQGVGPRGAFGQVVMTGEGAIPIEFGSRIAAPLAPLRRALGGMS
jgi:hypothetical protein